MYKKDNKNERNYDVQRKKMHYSPNLLDCIKNALEQNKLAILEYESRENECSTREVEPMALIYKNRKRNLVAFCKLRNEYRTFRLDRINLIKVKQEKFVPKEDFVVEDFEKDEEYSDFSEHSRSNEEA